MRTVAAPAAYAREGAIEDSEADEQTGDEIFLEDDDDYTDDEDDDEMLLQDALEEMVAQAEGRDSFGAQFEDSEGDSEYVPPTKTVLSIKILSRMREVSRSKWPTMTMRTTTTIKRVTTMMMTMTKTHRGVDDRVKV